jgi:hypothetical protein
MVMGWVLIYLVVGSGNRDHQVMLSFSDIDFLEDY